MPVHWLRLHLSSRSLIVSTGVRGATVRERAYVRAGVHAYPTGGRPRVLPGPLEPREQLAVQRTDEQVAAPPRKRGAGVERHAERVEIGAVIDGGVSGHLLRRQDSWVPDSVGPKYLRSSAGPGENRVKHGFREAACKRVLLTRMIGNHE